MSLLPGRIIPQDVPIGKVNEDGTVTIDKDWWLLLYNLCLQTLGTTGTTLPTDDQILLTELDDAAADGNDVRPQVADIERLATLEEPQTTTDAADIAELQALSASFAEDPIIARFTAQWDGITPASGGGTAKFLRADGAWAIPPGGAPPVGANPSASVGLAAVNGVAATFMTSDSAPPLSQAIVPTWTGAHVFAPSAVVVPITVTIGVHALSAMTLASASYAWGASQQVAIDIGGAGALRADTGNAIGLASNMYFNGSNWIYKTTAAVCEFVAFAGGFAWNTAASGTAGTAASTTTKMALSNLGALSLFGSIGINNVSPPAQPTGYGTPTGGALVSSFAAGSITAAQVAAELAQLILDLKKYGILGA